MKLKMLFLLLNHKTIPTRGASAPQKPVRVHPKPGYALGEETRTETGPRPQQDRPPPRSRPRTTPGSAASSPGRRNRGPATVPAARQAGRPAQAGQLTATTTASGPGPPAPKRRQRPPRSTAGPSPSRPATIPATAAGPPHGPPRPHSAQTADAPTRRPTTSPTPPGRPQDAASAALLLYTPVTDDSPPGRPPRAHAGQLDRQRIANADRQTAPTVYIIVGIYSHHNHNRIIYYHNNI